ncbi:MAG TPA: hypothetical protein VFR77_06990 [Steroidobacteraceae bacterium]|nr:hypothetical protein [Steroidobacteraceae bacterium]
MTDAFYAYPSGLFALIILLLMVLALEAGFRIGTRAQSRTSEVARSQVEGMQTSLLGVLALMLGFTFSIALERFNGRSEAVVDEANAIGTAYLRSGLLAESERAEVHAIFSEYADVRARTVTLAWGHTAQRAPLNAEAQRLQGRLWEHAAASSRAAPSPATTGLYVQALNEMIDAHTTLTAQVDRHVPELVLVLLFSAFVVSGGIIGYSAGLAGHRPSRATFVMVALVVMLMFMIMDLDRPRRGIIQVSPQSLLDVKAAIDRADGSFRP